MVRLETVLAFLEGFAPRRLAEDWDNVGLLVGRRGGEVARAMTCLTITPRSAAEAIAGGAQLIVVHHPLPFHPLKRLTDETPSGRMLLDLVAAGVAVYSPHTAFDSAAEGINQRLAEALGLLEIAPLRPLPEGEGTGRIGRLAAPATLGALAERLKAFLQIDALQRVGRGDQLARRVAIGCGAAGELLDDAIAAGCDAMVLGETSFHTCLKAETLGVGLLLPGHFASERFAVERLAEVLARQFPDIAVWASRDEKDPLEPA